MRNRREQHAKHKHGRCTDELHKDEVMALVNKGVSYKEIAEGLGVSLTSFKNRCKELGVKSKRGRKRNRH